MTTPPPVRFAAERPSLGPTREDRSYEERWISSVVASCAVPGSEIVVEVQVASEYRTDWRTITTVRLPMGEIEARVDGLFVHQRPGDLLRLDVKQVGTPGDVSVDILFA